MSIQEDAAVKTITLTIDGVEVSVPEGTLVIRAAEEIGVQIPRFCDHPLLDPVGACRQCLVEVSMPDREGNVRPMPKPQASCTIAVAEGMQVKTQHTSEAADKAQKGVMELLLVNHPLDCPVCDKGGECPLQNQAMSNGYAESRFVDIKRTFPKPINISSQVLLDRERCVLCARCTRFSNEIAGDPFIQLIERGALQQVGIYEEQPFESYFSGNTVQICPVGALTGAAYRFRSRPFDLVSTPSVCEHCAGGCSLRVDHRRGSVLRRMALEDPAVNEEWNCDKGRWAFAYASQPDRLRDPVVRGADGNYQVVSWEVALRAAAAGLDRAKQGTGTGVLVGGRVTLEDAYAYSKFARLALGTNDVDFRSRPQSAEEADFLASSVVGTTDVTYTRLEESASVLLVGLESEEESAGTFLRLRKGVRKRALKVYSIAPFASRGLRKLDGTLLSAAPGTEGEVLISLAGGGVAQGRVELGPDSVILVGERMATSPGALTAAAKLARSTGAALAWVPRRAGDRGAVEAGALPTLLPGGRPLGSSPARDEVSAIWGAPVPDAPGRDTDGIIAAAGSGELSALVVGGIDPDDLPDPTAARAALQRSFVVSLDFRESPVHEYADVILPIAPQQEKAGTFLNWEGRERQFQQALESTARSDHAMLDLIAAEMGVVLGTRGLTDVRREITLLGGWEGAAAGLPSVAPGGPSEPGPGEAVLATWAQLLDKGRLQDGEPFLAGTARRTVARLSAATATSIGATDGEPVQVSTDRGSITVPLVVTDMPDHVVWIPTNSRGSQVRPTLGALAGDAVRIAPGPRTSASDAEAERVIEQVDGGAL